MQISAPVLLYSQAGKASRLRQVRVAPRPRLAGSRLTTRLYLSTRSGPIGDERIEQIQFTISNQLLSIKPVKRLELLVIIEEKLRVSTPQNRLKGYEC